MYADIYQKKIDGKLFFTVQTKHYHVNRTDLDTLLCHNTNPTNNNEKFYVVWIRLFSQESDLKKRSHRHLI